MPTIEDIVMVTIMTDVVVVVVVAAAAMFISMYGKSDSFFLRARKHVPDQCS